MSCHAPKQVPTPPIHPESVGCPAARLWRQASRLPSGSSQIVSAPATHLFDSPGLSRWRQVPMIATIGVPLEASARGS